MCECGNAVAVRMVVCTLWTTLSAVACANTVAWHGTACGSADEPVCWQGDSNDWRDETSGEFRFPGAGDVAQVPHVPAAGLDGNKRFITLEDRLGQPVNVTVSALELRVGAGAETVLTAPAGGSITTTGPELSAIGHCTVEDITGLAVLDVNGGAFNAGGETRVETRFTTAFSNCQTKVIVRNGGRFNVSAGTFSFRPGYWDGDGPYAELEVADGGRFVIGDTCSDFRQGDGANNGWGSMRYTVDGGALLAENRAQTFHVRCGDKGFNRIDVRNRGVFDLGKRGEAVSADDQGLIDFQNSARNEIVISDSLFRANVTGGFPNTRLTIEIRGDSTVSNSVDYGLMTGQDGGYVTWRCFGASANNQWWGTRVSQMPEGRALRLLSDFRIGSDSIGSEFGVSPQFFHALWKNGSNAEYLFGHWRLAPAGGLQLIDRDEFVLKAMPDGGNDHHLRPQPKLMGRVFGAEGPEAIWDSYVATNRNMTIASWGLGWSWPELFCMKLKDSAASELSPAMGVVRWEAVFSSPLARGYVRLPACSGRRDFRKVEIVRLAVLPENGHTLDEIVAELNSGFGNAKVEHLGDYNVSLEMPMEKLVANSSAYRLLFDFTDVADAAAAEAGAETVRARVARIGLSPGPASGFVITVR